MYKYSIVLALLVCGAGVIADWDEGPGRRLNCWIGTELGGHAGAMA
jgi:hypothetical protein